jgi:hypothetical protein
MLGDDQFNNWCDQWDKAQKEGVFKDRPKPHVPSPQIGGDEDFFGNSRPPEVFQEGKRQVRDVDAKYWKKLYELSKQGDNAPDILSESAWQTEGGTLPEQAPKATKKGMADRASKLGNTPNPVYPNTYGPDQKERKVTPNWTDGKELLELHNMKVNLHELESKFNAAWAVGQDGKMKSVKRQIDGLKQIIDELSNVLTPNFLSDYLS